MIQTVMLIALGFLMAIMLIMFIAPAFLRRAARLTTLKLQSKLPYTLSDFEAQKDQIRAEYAIRIRRLEVSSEQIKENSAKLRVNLNKREMEIQELKAQNINLRAHLAEKNSRAVVLEQTVRTEIPALNHQLLKVKSELKSTERLLSVAHENIENQDTKLSHAARTERIRQQEIERLRTVVSVDNPKKPVQTRGFDVANTEEYEQLLTENRRLQGEFHHLQNELAQLKNFEQRELPKLKQEFKDLGSRLLSDLSPEAAPPAPNGVVKHHNTLAERLEEATRNNSA